MKLIHTLLFLFRQEYFKLDIELATACLKSLELSTYKTVIIYNQGFLDNLQVETLVSKFALNCIVIGDAANVGTTVGRKKCLEYIWEHYPDTEYISEIHLDMIFCNNWEDPLISYLESNDEPVVSCGIVDQFGTRAFLDSPPVALPNIASELVNYLTTLRVDIVVHGFTNPCIHVSEILKQTNGYNVDFLKGKHAFEDDSMLLGYYYYYGTKRNWKPKVNYNSVVFHITAGQRNTLGESVYVNYDGLVKQYGAMGLKHLSELHKNEMQKNFFLKKYQSLIN